MMQRNRRTPTTLETEPTLPVPSKGSRWRWSTSRRAMVGGGVLAVALGLGGTAAAASTSANPPSAPGQHGKAPAGSGRPAAIGKITALSADTITVEAKGKASETVTYSSTTKFRTMSGASSSAAIKVGDFIAAQGTTSSDGNINATTIMISTTSPGPMGRGGTGRAGGTVPRHQGAAAG